MNQGPIKRHVLRATYAALLEAGEWIPIRGCPGRSVLRGAHDVSPADLLGAAAAVHRFEVDGAADPVVVGVLVGGGGLLSYAKPGGTWVHTLNTEGGLARKLAELGIRLP